MVRLSKDGSAALTGARAEDTCADGDAGGADCWRQCASNTVSLRSVPKSPLVESFDLTSSSGPKASERTTQLLRVYNLSDELGSDFRPAAQEAPGDQRPRAVGRQRLCNVGAGFSGRQEDREPTTGAALDLYGASVLHAYDYLFDPRFAATRNPYDPKYRGACDLYNGGVGVGAADRLRKQGARARRHQDDQHGLAGPGT